MAGSSNFTSWVRTATASFGPRPISSATSSGQPTTSRSTSGNRSGRRERRPTVDDDRLEAQLAREAHEGARDLDGPDDDESRPDREDLDEQRAVADLGGARQAALEGLAGRRDELRVERRRSPSVPSSRPSSWTTSSGTGGAPSPGVCWPNPAGGESAGSGVMTAAPCPPAPCEATAARDRRRRHGRLDEDVDRAAAGQPDVPGLLVADAVADDPGVAGRPGVLDLLGRGALDAATADRPGDAPVGRVQQDRALRPRRGPERAHDDGPPDLGAVRLPGLEGRQELLHGMRPRRGRVGRASPATAARWPEPRSRRWCPRAGRRGRPPPSPGGCRPCARRRGSRPAARARRRSRPAGSRRCTGRPRASRRRGAGSRACRPAG